MIWNMATLFGEVLIQRKKGIPIRRRETMIRRIVTMTVAESKHVKIRLIISIPSP